MTAWFCKNDIIVCQKCIDENPELLDEVKNYQVNYSGNERCDFCGEKIAEK